MTQILRPDGFRLSRGTFPMLTKAFPFRGLALVFLVFIQVTFVDAQMQFHETINILQTAYHNEILANLTYLAYAQKAISDKFPNIAHFFVALSASESIHARNFKQLLSDFGVEVTEISEAEIRISTTKENLQIASQNELQDIDQNYPQFVEKITSENHEAAIRILTYTWEAEKTHRDLIKKLQSGIGTLFGILGLRMDTTFTQYFVCQTCGSVITDHPPDICPICKSPVSQYNEVKRRK
jgi:rubrerythrin